MISLCLPFVVVTSLVAAASATKIKSDLAEVQNLYTAGMELVQRGLLDEAIQTFQRGLNLDPANLVLLNAAGAAYSLKGNREEAQRHFLSALKVDPQFEPARKNLAIAYFDSGQYDLAIPQFERLTQSSHSKPVAFLFLGMIAEKRKDSKAAVDFLEKAGELVFQYPQALLSFAQSLHELGQSERSRSVLDRLERSPRVSAADLFRAGALYSHLGNYSMALEKLEKARGMDPHLPSLDYHRAFVLHKIGSSKEALRILQELNAGKPDARALNLLAHVAQELQQINLSIQSFRKAAELEPGREENYLDYSTLCMNHKNFPLALEIVEIGLANVAHSYRLLVQKGAILSELDRLAQAQETFRSAMKLQDDNREALLSLARVQERANVLDDAHETLAAGVGRYPNDYYMHYYYGFVLLELVRREGARGKEVEEKSRRALERSVQLNPSFAKSYFLLGKIYSEKEPQLAAAQFQTCLRLDPSDASAKYQLGRLYLKLGRRQEGESLLSQAKEQRSQQAEGETKPRIQVIRQ